MGRAGPKARSYPNGNGAAALSCSFVATTNVCLGFKPGLGWRVLFQHCFLNQIIMFSRDDLHLPKWKSHTWMQAWDASKVPSFSLWDVFKFWTEANSTAASSGSRSISSWTSSTTISSCEGAAAARIWKGVGLETASVIGLDSSSGENLALLQTGDI